MENSWKNFLKENALLFLAFFVVIGGLIGYTVYNGIKNVKENNTIIEGGPLVEAPTIVKTYDVNEYKIITKSDQDLAEHYLRQLVSMWYSDPGKLYDLMTDSAKSEYSSRDNCINRLNKLRSTKVLQSTVSKYKVDSEYVVILTNENVEFKLFTSGINDYKIAFMSQI